MAQYRSLGRGSASRARRRTGSPGRTIRGAGHRPLRAARTARTTRASGRWRTTNSAPLGAVENHEFRPKCISGVAAVVAGVPLNLAAAVLQDSAAVGHLAALADHLPEHVLEVTNRRNRVAVALFVSAELCADIKMAARSRSLRWIIISRRD